MGGGRGGGGGGHSGGRNPPDGDRGAYWDAFAQQPVQCRARGDPRQRQSPPRGRKNGTQGATAGVQCAEPAGVLWEPGLFKDVTTPPAEIPDRRKAVGIAGGRGMIRSAPRSPVGSAVRLQRMRAAHFQSWASFGRRDGTTRGNPRPPTGSRHHGWAWDDSVGPSLSRPRVVQCVVPREPGLIRKMRNGTTRGNPRPPKGSRHHGWAWDDSFGPSLSGSAVRSAVHSAVRTVHFEG